MNTINNSFNALPRPNNKASSPADFAQKMAALRASKLGASNPVSVPTSIAATETKPVENQVEVKASAQLNLSQNIMQKPETSANKPIRLGMIIDLKI